MNLRRRSFAVRRTTTTRLYAYFRGAEYPMGRVRALCSAWRMSARWPGMTDLGRSDFARRWDNLPTEDGWDTYEGKATTDEAKRTASSMVPVPVGHGGIQLEMHGGGADIEIEVAPSGKVVAVFWSPSDA